MREAAWFSFFPGLAIFITVLSLNLVGDGWRMRSTPPVVIHYVSCFSRQYCSEENDDLFDCGLGRMTGQTGVAVSTKFLAVGSLCPFPKAGSRRVARKPLSTPPLAHAAEALEQGVAG